ncbi:unnamed protein product [Laminaria digitata]
MMEEFSSYPKNHEHLLDGLVLSIHGFEEAEPRKMHVCDECFRSLKVDRIPEAALANGFWVGKLLAKFDSATKVERAAAYPVRVCTLSLSKRDECATFADQPSVLYVERQFSMRTTLVP